MSGRVYLLGMGVFARLFHRQGEFPAPLRADLDAQGLLYLAEAAGGSLRYADFRAPGKRFKGKRSGRVWGIAVTRSRLVVVTGGQVELDAPWRSPLGDGVDVQQLDGKLVIGFEGALRDPRSSGRVEIHAAVPDAERAVAVIASLR